MPIATVTELAGIRGIDRAAVLIPVSAGARILASNTTEATLTGLAFKVQDISAATQLVGPGVTDWDWEIEPVKGGRLQLHLAMTAFLSVNGQQDDCGVRTFDRTLQVQSVPVAWYTTGTHFLSNNWLGLAGIIGFLGGAIKGSLTARTDRFRAAEAANARVASAASVRAVESRLPMLFWIRRLAPLAIAGCVALSASVALGITSRGGPLTGTWTGYITGTAGSGVKRQHIRIVVNASERGGSWEISATCNGPLTLDSISNGYHHYLRKLARGASCAGGDIDCLKRAGANVYDAVTSHRGGEYDSSGTLHRVRG